MNSTPPSPARRRALAGALLAPLVGPSLARVGSIWRVGAGEAITRMADALARAADGDTLEILPGTYRGDVAVITQRRLSIVGIGEQPVF